MSGLTAPRRPAPVGASRTAITSTRADRRGRARLAGSWLLTLGVLGLLGYAGWWQTRAEVSPITHVDVRGEFRHLDGRQIESAVRPYLAKGFWGLDMDELDTALREVPWVEGAELRRVWPGRLVIALRERHALAAWADGGYVSTAGVHFTPDGGPAAGLEGLAVLSGPEAAAGEAAERYAELAPMLAQAGLVLRTLGTDARRAWHARVQAVAAEGAEAPAPIELNLGSADLRARLARFVSVYTQVLAKDERAVASADLRYANGLAVRFVTGNGEATEQQV